MISERHQYFTWRDNLHNVNILPRLGNARTSSGPANVMDIHNSMSVSNLMAQAIDAVRTSHGTADAKDPHDVSVLPGVASL